MRPLKTAFLLMALNCIFNAQVIDRQLAFKERGWSIHVELPRSPRFGPDGQGWNNIDLDEMEKAGKNVLILFSGVYFFEGHFWEIDPGRVQVTMLIHRSGPVEVVCAQSWWIANMKEYTRKPDCIYKLQFPTRILHGHTWAEVRGLEHYDYGSSFGKEWRVYLLPIGEVGCIELKFIISTDQKAFLEPKWKNRIEGLINTVLNSLTVTEGPRTINTSGYQLEQNSQLKVPMG